MAMEAQTSPSPPFSTEGLGPCELSYSHSINNYDDHDWVFWSTCGNDEGGCEKPHHLSATADGAVIKDQIIRFLQTIWCRCRLVQFWGLVKVGDKTYLTTCDQPFAFQYYHFDGQDVKQLCEYRKHCLEYLLPVDDDGDEVQLIIGPPGRVFRSGLPEHAWDVRHYTSREYPQRDYAVVRVRECWALPICHPTRHLPIGVLEIVAPHFFSIPRRWVLEKDLQEVNLTTTCVRIAEASSCLRGEIATIHEALRKMRKIYGLGYGVPKTWTISGEILSSYRGLDFIRKGQGVVGRAFSSKSACFCRDIRELSITEYPLVVNARSLEYSACFAVCLQSSCSNNCIYVLEFFLPMYEEDPRTLLNSIMEKLKYHLRSSFKIASGQELGQKLTIEVIKVSPEDEFDSFEICSATGIESTPRLGEVQGGEGMMQLDFSSKQVDAANGSMNGIHEQQNGSVGSTPWLAKAQGGEGMLQVESANAYINGVHGQQSGIVESPLRPECAQSFINIPFPKLILAGVDVPHNFVSGIYEHQYGVVESPHRQDLPQNIENIAHDEGNMEIDVANPERGGASIEPSDSEVIKIKKQKSSRTLKSELGITREVLEQNSWRNLKDAAKVLEVSRSTLKRICRECGINRWPPRKPRKVNQAFAEQRVVQPCFENIEERHRPDTTRLEDDSSVSVKVEYQGYTIKFRLPLSASKSNLEEKVARRLNLPIGNLKIEYQDEENEWIWITCDEDLSTCMSTLSSLDRTTIRMLVR